MGRKHIHGPSRGSFCFKDFSDSEQNKSVNFVGLFT